MSAPKTQNGSLVKNPPSRLRTIRISESWHLGPAMRAVTGLDELHGDAHAVASLTHRTFDEVGRVQLLTDAPDVAVLAPELVRRGAGDNAQIGHLGERRSDLLGHAVGEECLRRVARHIRKR